MWQTGIEQLSESTYRYRLFGEDNALSFGEVFESWRTNPDFCGFFAGVLAASPFHCYCWETPAQTSQTLGQAFECVLVDSPSIDIAPDTRDFERYFRGEPPGSVVRFDNLSRDALLVVPTPVDSNLNYSHIAAFTRNAPLQQQCELWRLVGYEMQDRLTKKPVWLNTAGGGVAWLHVRLDNSPKYYRHSDYRVRPVNPGR